jgi:phospholipase C
MHHPGLVRYRAGSPFDRTQGAPHGTVNARHISDQGAPTSFGRRQFLGAAATGVAGLALGSWTSDAGASAVPGARRLSRGAVALRQPGSLPDPRRPAGTDLIPEIEHIVVVMMENHSFDNMLGMLGRGDGFALNANGVPKASCPDGKGNLVHAFHMPSECQTDGVGNNWNTAHGSYDNGSNQGFVTSSSGETMGYFLGSDMPFTWGLASTFPIADRWFCSVLAQTDPNRRYLISGTSLGLINDSFPSPLPPNGTIFDSFNKYGITWRDYFSDLPSAGVYLPLIAKHDIAENVVTIDHFFSDAAAGSLPQFSLIDPNFTIQSEENPQNVQYGDQFLSDVVNAVMSSPQWPKTMLIWNYDEWGGWYDHVAPPAAVPPDDVPPDLPPGSLPGAFDRYGFRVPAGVVSPLAKKNYVSHTVFDHTSVLKTVEAKWNLPALTRRDANANDVFDMLDLKAKPRFLRPPVLPDPANPVGSYACMTTGPGQIPPPGAVRPA